MQRKLTESDLHPILGGMIGNPPLGRIERQFRRPLLDGIEDIDDFNPGSLLGVVNLSQVENVPLHPSATTDFDLLGDRPGAMILPIFETVMTMQKRFPHTVGWQIISWADGRGRGLVCTKPNSREKTLTQLSQLEGVRKRKWLVTRDRI